MEMTLTNRVNIAKRITANTAAIKDWRVRNKHNRALREIARQLTAGKGYIIASVRELKQRYGELCLYEVAGPGADRKTIWAIMSFPTGKYIFAPV
jgi:hypothetical protein|uniref:Uncharacterized protein n=1 Tax=virus sp. ctoYX9 TaxID=2825822 RepID=A0A8S5RPC5_9VIRU|nr:MAG TPA: hypothetical protein [virus sp. ctoYX9]